MDLFGEKNPKNALLLWREKKITQNQPKLLPRCVVWMSWYVIAGQEVLQSQGLSTRPPASHTALTPAVTQWQPPAVTYRKLMSERAAAASSPGCGPDVSLSEPLRLFKSVPRTPTTDLHYHHLSPTALLSGSLGLRGCAMKSCRSQLVSCDQVCNLPLAWMSPFGSRLPELERRVPSRWEEENIWG